MTIKKPMTALAILTTHTPMEDAMIDTTECQSCGELRAQIEALTEKRNVCIRRVESVQDQLLELGHDWLAGELRTALGALKYG
jgi:hypothetical protein